MCGMGDGHDEGGKVRGDRRESKKKRVNINT